MSDRECLAKGSDPVLGMTEAVSKDRIYSTEDAGCCRVQLLRVVLLNKLSISGAMAAITS